MTQEIEDSLKNKEHWAKFVMSVTLPPNYTQAAIDRYKQFTGRALTKRFVHDVRNGRSYDRLLHKILHTLGKEHEESRLQGSALGKASGQAIGTVRT